MNYDKEKLKEIILTDYIDGRLGEEEKNKIDAFIAQHEDLQAFYEQVVGCAIKPFEKDQGDMVAPDRVWHSIEDKLDTLEQSPTILDRLFQPFLELLKQPQLAFAGGIMAAILVVAVFLYQQHQTKVARYNQEAQIEYFMLLAETNPKDQWDGTIIETRLEKYFL
jgi:anti-sigma factor RsiW